MEQVAATTEVKATEQVTAPEQKTEATQENPQMQALLKKERFIRDQQKQFQTEKQAWEAEKAALQSAAKEKEEWAQLLKQNPYKLYEKLGMKSDEVASLLANQPDPQAQEFEMLKSELQALKDELKASKTQSEESQVQAYENVKKQIAFDIENSIKGKEDFEVLNSYGATGIAKVVELIETYFNETGKILEHDYAAKLVEDQYLEEAVKFASLKKVQSKLQPQATKEEPKQEAPKQTQKAQPQFKTLSNAMPTTTIRAHSAKSEQERIERAKLAFAGKI